LARDSDETAIVPPFLCGGRKQNFTEINMTEQFRVSLHHPVFVFIWGFSLLLVGCFIGIHWHPSQTATLSIAASGAFLMVIHEVSYGFFWISLTAWWIGSRHPGNSALGKRSHLRW